MPLAAFAVAIAYWPGFYYPGDSARWIMFSALVPMALIFLTPPRSRLWWLGAAFLVYAIGTLAWTISPSSTVFALWKLALFAAAVVAGASLSERSFRLSCLAFALGISVSGIVALSQVMGWSPSYGGYSVVQVAAPAGLFVNRNGMAEAGLLAVILTIHYRAWWLLPLCLMAAFLPVSKGVIMAAFVAVAVAHLRKRWLVTILAGGAVSVAVGKLLISAGNQGVDGRLSLWADTINGLRWFGYGGGAFDAAYPTFADLSTSMFFSFNALPGSPHGDILLLLSEYGIGALLLFAFVGVVLWKTRYEPLAPVVAAFLVMGLVDFPFQQPATGFIACLCLGRLLRAGLGLRGRGDSGGNTLYRGHERPRADTGDVRGA